MHTVGRARFKSSNNRVVVAGLLELLVLEYAVVLLKSMNYMIILESTIHRMHTFKTHTSA